MIFRGLQLMLFLHEQSRSAQKLKSLYACLSQFPLLAEVICKD